MSVASRSTCRQTLSRYIDRDVSVNISIDTSAESWSICRSAYRPTYRSRGAQTTHDPYRRVSYITAKFSRVSFYFFFCSLFSYCCCCCFKRKQTIFPCERFFYQKLKYFSCVDWFVFIIQLYQKTCGQKTDVNLLILEVMILCMNILPSFLRMRCSK